MSENIIDPTVVPNSEPISTLVSPVVPPPKKFPALTLILLILLLLTATLVIYLFLQVRQLTLEKLTPSPTPTPSPSADPTAGWKTYTHKDLGFEIKVPTALEIIEKPVIRIGDKISIFTSTNNPESCKGDCQIIDEAETKIVNQTTMRYLSGWWGEIGGNIAQSYVSYVIPLDGNYIQIQLQELPFSAEYIPGRNIQKIQANELQQFDQILSTFKFTNDLRQNALYTCPQNGWVNCMPILSEEGQKACSDEAMDWYKSNCPDFQGAAL